MRDSLSGVFSGERKTKEDENLRLCKPCSLREKCIPCTGDINRRLDSVLLRDSAPALFAKAFFFFFFWWMTKQLCIYCALCDHRIV